MGLSFNRLSSPIPPRFLARLPVHRAAFFAYLLLAAIFYAPLLLGLRTFPDGDFTHHFLPFSLFQQREFLAGRLPLWNPYTYSGHPFLADVQAAVFYPLSNLFLAFTLPWAVSGARLYFLQLEAMFHIALAGFFVYLLLHELTGDRAAALLAGVVFAFSGYLTGYPPLQLAILRTAVWLPLILWLLWRGFHSPQQSRWWWAPFGHGALAYTSAFLAGHAQAFLYMTYVIAAWVVFLFAGQLIGGMQRQRGAETRLPHLLGVALFVVLTAGLSAGQLLPGLEFTRLSVRANVDYAFVSGGFPLQDTWQILLPGVLTQFSPLYIGVVGLGLVGVAVGHWSMGIGRARTSPPIPYTSYLTFFISLSLIALLLSYGDNAFLYPLFYRYAPGWKLFRGQERAAYLVAFGLSMLAGYGAALLPGMEHRRRRRIALTVGALATGGVYSFGLLWQLVGRAAVAPWAYLGIAFVTLALAMAVSLMIWLPGWSRRRSLLLFALAGGNLFWANFTTNLSDFGPARKTILAPEMEALQQAVEAQPASLGLPVRVYNEYRIYEDYGMRQEIEDVWGSSPLRLARYAALFDHFPLDRLWQLTGVEYMLTWRRELFEPSALLAEFPQTADTTFLHLLTEPNPRAWLAHQARVVDDEESLRLLADHTFDLETIALLPPEFALAGGIAQPGHSAITLRRLAPNRLHVQVESEHGGLLVLSENWMPGWRVEEAECRAQQMECVNLQSPIPNLPPLSVMRANLTFIGVPIPPGQIGFELVYWPESVRFGLWISGGTLAALALVSAWHGWRNKKEIRTTLNNFTAKRSASNETGAI
jgi:hypothetical protein